MTQQFHCWDYILSALKHQFKEPMRPMFTAAQFIIAKWWKQPKCPLANEWIKKVWYIYTMEFYTAERKREFIPFATAWMELESNMLSKLGGEGQIPYHLTFNWNLINKTNKQASKI